uniref:Actin related protein 8 n=1 Tax=Eptatretus burgeri TaxID=7764 RepID=A0A8C4NC82_EPTBU
MSIESLLRIVKIPVTPCGPHHADRALCVSYSVMTSAEREGVREKDKDKDREKEKEQRGTKRPIVPASIPEPQVEQIHSNFVIVIHPGSTTLRLGRASDTLPTSIPHVVARRHKASGQLRRDETWLLRDGIEHADSKEQRHSGLKMVEQAIWSRKMSNGLRRIPTHPEQLAAYNSRMKPFPLDTCPRVKWTNTFHKPECLIGDEALHVNYSEPYSLHWPMHRGKLNLHQRSGGSLSAVLADLETIWIQAIHKFLDIAPCDLKYYRCIVLVPDMCSRQHVKGIMNMLLNSMGFTGVIVQQESVCATFGCGLSCACVVDIGDQKMSVCCVEDGISHRNTRLWLEYGGADVTRCFYWLMERSGFPFTKCQLGNRHHALLLQQLKENFCHLHQDISGIQDHEFKLRLPDSPPLLYRLKLGDEKLQAPMALFYPASFGIVGQRMTLLQQRSQGDPEDPHDEHYLMATQSKQEQAAKAVAERRAQAKHAALDTETGGPEATERPGLSGSYGEAATHGSADVSLPHGEHDEAAPSVVSRKLSSPQFEGKALGIDKAILHSIECCGE